MDIKLYEVSLLKHNTTFYYRLSHGRLWVRVSAGLTKDHHKNGTNCLPALHTCVMVGV